MLRKKNGIGVKNFIIVFLIIIIGVVGIYFYTNRETQTKTSIYEEFKLLTVYMQSQGYTCNSLMKSGNSCEKKAAVNSYTFFRYDDGFQYIFNSKNYKVNITSRSGGTEYTLQTFEGAFSGYNNRKYYCTTDNNTVLGNFVNCKTEDNKILDNDVYIGVDKTAFMEVENILNNSGYDSSKIASIFKWEK